MIYYWNKNYFEELKAIGETLLLEDGLELFGSYCLSKERGLKKFANSEASKFITNVEKRPVPEQRQIVVFLCKLNYDHPEVHSLLNYPIQEFIRRVLAVWIEHEPNAIEAYRWYVQYCAYDLREKSLKQALALAPNDKVIVEYYLNGLNHDLEFMVHHLNQNVLLGDRLRADVLLAEFRRYLNNLNPSEAKTYLQSEYDHYKELFKLWDIYKAGDYADNFPDWAKKKHKFIW